MRGLANFTERADLKRANFNVATGGLQQLHNLKLAFDFRERSKWRVSSFYTGRFWRENAVPKIGDHDPLYQ